jgi:hypothetical protein
MTVENISINPNICPLEYFVMALYRVKEYLYHILYLNSYEVIDKSIGNNNRPRPAHRTGNSQSIGSISRSPSAASCNQYPLSREIPQNKCHISLSILLNYNNTTCCLKSSANRPSSRRQSLLILFPTASVFLEILQVITYEFHERQSDYSSAY